jgi:hypothetical protein
MSTWGCGSPASYCQPSAAAGFVYLEFSWTHAPFVFSSMQLCLPVTIAVCFFLLFRLRMGSTPPPLSHGACHTLAAVASLPLSKHTGGGGTTATYSGQHVYLQFTGKYPCPTLQWNPPQDSHCYKLSHSKAAGQVPPLLASLAGLFIYSSMRECPSPTLWSSGCPAVFATFLFFFFSYLFIIQLIFFSFFPGWGSVCPGGLCWSGPGLSVGVPRTT